MNIKYFTDRVNQKNEIVFNEIFWKNLDGVCLALDNVKARKYVDQQCILYSKNFFEAGTLGTICNSQVVVPFETICYSDLP